MRAIVNANAAHVMTPAEAAASVRSVLEPVGVVPEALRADAWIHLLHVEPRCPALTVDAPPGSARLDAAALQSAARHLLPTWSPTFEALFEPLTLLPLLADEAQRIALVRTYAALLAPRLAVGGDNAVDAFDASCKYQGALLRLALQYIDPTLAAHLARVRATLLDELAADCLATAFAPVADLPRRALIVDALLVANDVTLPFFVLVALLLTRRDAVLAAPAASLTRAALVDALGARDDATLLAALRSVPSVVARLPASMPQQVQATHHTLDSRQWRRWRLYALSAPCLRISLAELVMHRPATPAHFGIDVRRAEALRAGRLVACAQQIPVSDVLNKGTRLRLVQQLAAMRGSHIALLGAGDGAHDDNAVAQFARELIASDICHVSVVVGGYRNAHDAFMQGKRQILTGHRVDLCDECRTPPPSSMYWRALPSGVGDGPDGDVSDVQLLADAAAVQLSSLGDAMKRGAVVAAEARRRAAQAAATAAAAAARRATATGAALKQKIGDALAEPVDLDIATDQPRASTPPPSMSLAAPPAVTSPTAAEVLITQEVDDDSWLRFDLDDERPPSPPATTTIVESVATPAYDVRLSEFADDAVFFCESIASDHAPRHLAVSADRVLELVRQERVGDFCNIVDSVELVDVATMAYTLSDITFERRSAPATPMRIRMTDMALRDKIVAFVTGAVKSARRRQRQAARAGASSSAKSDDNAADDAKSKVD